MANVFIESEHKKVKINAKNVKEALEILNINPETVLIVKNNEIILLNELLKDDDEIKILNIMSGG
jgi:sulfur carrier protein ThiS